MISRYAGVHYSTVSKVLKGGEIEVAWQDVTLIPVQQLVISLLHEFDEFL